MKKLFSVLLASLMIMMSIPLATLQVLAAPDVPTITGVEFDSVYVVENYDGDFIYASNEVSYFHYKYEELPSFRVDFEDGSFEYCEDGYLWYDGESYYLECTDTQSPDNPWGLGSHTVNYTLCGYSGTFEVEVVDTLIDTIEIEPMVYIENYDGYEETDENGNTYWCYNIVPDYFNLYLKIGMSCMGYDGSFYYNGNDYYMDIKTEQSFDNQLTVGENKIAFELYGYEGEFTVTILENPVESVDVKPITFIENAGGYWTTDYYRDNNWNWVESDPYYFYFMDTYEFTVNFKDGTSVQSEDGVIRYNDDIHWLRADDEQSYENYWTLGNNYVSYNILGYKGEFNIKVIESPVQSVDIKPIKVIENAAGNYISDSYYDKVTGEIIEGEYYYYYEDCFLPDFTVTLKDGTVLESENGEVFYNNTYYNIEYNTMQSLENPYVLGKNTVECDVMGVPCTMELEVIESPVESIEFDKLTLRYGTDGTFKYKNGRKWFQYEYEPTYTVKMKDGATVTGDFEKVVYANILYWATFEDDQSYDNQWSAGEHNVSYEIMGVTGEFTVETVETVIDRVEVKPIKLIEEVDGVLRNYDDNPETGGYDYCDEYYYYNYRPEFTAYFSDGTVLESENGYIEYENGSYCLEYDDGQSSKNAWTAGVHEVEYSILGYKSTFEVEIIDTPIESIEFEPISFIHEYEATTRHQNGVKYNYYDFYNDVEYTVTLKNGDKIKSEGLRFYYEGKSYLLNYENSQSADNEWGIGTHNVPFSILGYEGTFPVEITASPIVDITFKPIKVIKNHDGRFLEEFITDDIIGNTSTPVKYFRYNYSLEYTVTFADGTRLEGFGDMGVVYDGARRYLSYRDPQSYNNQWDVGTHTVECNMMGYNTSFTVEVVPSPIERIEMKPITLIKNYNGFWHTDSYWDDEQGMMVDTPKYWRYTFTPEFTAFLTDGTKIESTYGNINIDGRVYYLSYVLDQSYENQLTVGTHTLPFNVLGYYGEFSFEITESLITNIEFEPIEYIAHYDGYETYDTIWDSEKNEWVRSPDYWRYRIEPEFKITLVDGTVLESQNGRVEYDGDRHALNYELYQAYDHELSIGSHTVDCSILGYSTSFTVDIVKSPVKNITVEPIVYKEHTNGYWNTEWMNGVPMPKYWHYNVDPEFTVEFEDGTFTKANGDYFTYDGEYYRIEYEPQSYDNYYEVGINEVECWAYGYEGIFQVEILPSPVSEFTTAPLEIIENTNGHLVTDYVYNYEIHDYEEFTYWEYNFYIPEYAVTLNDGTVLESNEYGDIEYEGDFYWPEIDFDQTYENQLTIGTHEIPVLIMGHYGTLTVNIVESPFKSIVANDLFAYEYQNGSWVTDYVYDSEEPREVEYWHYNIHPSYAVTLKDGTVLESDDYGVVTHGGKDYEMTFYDPQWPLDPFTVGTYYIEYTFADLSGMFEFTVLPAETVLNGWVDVDGTWYFYENGTMVTNEWRKDSVGWCYLLEDGRMATNMWLPDSKGWCYIEADGYCATNCWKKDSIGWIWLDGEGSMTKNAWVEDGGKWYYLDHNGYMVVNNWMADSVGWVYVGEDGAMLTNAWVMDSVGWCYVGADGYAVTSCWMADSIGWCYLDAEGRMVTNDKVQDSNGWCYLDANGYWDGKYL